MRNKSQDWDVLDLTDAEGKVLWTLLEYGTLSVSGTSRRAGVARTTVDAALRRLSQRKLVRKVPSHGGQVSLWKAVRPEKARHELMEAAEPFDRATIPLQGDEVAGGIDATEIGIMVYRGRQQILQAYEQTLSLSRAERVFMVQGNRSAEKAFKDIDKQYVLDFQDKFRKARIILEGFSGESLFSLLKKLSVEELRSHADRMLIATILGDSFMDFALDLLVMRDTVVVIDMEREIVIIIKNQGIVDMLCCFCLFFQEYGRHINYNREIWKIIEEKEKM